MNIVIFTTQTTHHAYFIQQILKYQKNINVFLEKKTTQFPFTTNHKFETDSNYFEQEIWFRSKSNLINQMVQTEEYQDINDLDSIRKIREIAPDLIIVFGTGILRKDILESIKCPILNLHGGDPEKYRGLDSHLWGIYHNDFESLIVTLHHVEPELDTGDIILQDTINIRPKMKLKELRSENTKICVNLVASAIDNFQKYGSFLQRKQRKKGRYYSAMPIELKEICLKNFELYIQRYPNG